MVAHNVIRGCDLSLGSDSNIEALSSNCFIIDSPSMWKLLMWKKLNGKIC